MGERQLNGIEEFLSISSPKGPFEIKEKGSRFISYIYPVKDSNSSDEILQEIKKKYFDSTHVCFAYRIGDGVEKSVKYSDDGEPGGTAGLPIISEIRSHDLFNALIAVIRYYGGTKLGTGGLARAYRSSAKLAIDGSEVVTIISKKTEDFLIHYDFLGNLMNITKKFNLEILERKYMQKGIQVKISIPVSRYESVKSAIIDSSKGKITF